MLTCLTLQLPLNIHLINANTFKSKVMKKIILLFMTVALSYSLCAQNDSAVKPEKEIKTLFGSTSSHGGFLGFMGNYGKIGNQDAAFVGARTGWIINHCFSMGLAGYGFSSNMDFDNYPQSTRHSFQGAYAGIFIEPTIAPRYPVHLSFPIIMGVGGVARVEPGYMAQEYDNSNMYVRDSQGFLIINPGVELEINLVKFVRLGIGAQYKYTTELSLDNSKSDILDGFSGGMSLKFGKF